MNVFIIDDHDLVRAGLRMLLESHGVQVVGEADNGRDALEAVVRARPDVVLMDLTMPDLNGIDASRRLLADVPSLKIVAVSMNSDRRSVTQMFAAGAVGYLLKSCAADELMFALQAVAKGHKYVSPKVTGLVVEQLASSQDAAAKPKQAAPKALTSREREVLQLVAEGKSTKEISDRMQIASATVDTHRRQIMDKLGLRTIAELTKFAIREGLTGVN